MVYLIHFDQKLKHAQHYLGFVKTARGLDARMKHHLNGTGSKLMAALSQAGIKWSVVRTWPEGDRTFERTLKNRKKSASLCPICRANKKSKS